MSENLIDVSQDLCSGDIKEKKSEFYIFHCFYFNVAFLTLVSNLWLLLLHVTDSE